MQSKAEEYEQSMTQLQEECKGVVTERDREKEKGAQSMEALKQTKHRLQEVEQLTQEVEKQRDLDSEQVGGS